MRFTTTTTIAALAAMTPLASAVGSAIVINQCDFPVYLWSVGGSVGEMQTLVAKDGGYSELMHTDESSGGIALKITLAEDGLYTGSPQTVFAYALGNQGRVAYDLSDVFGDPFAGHTLHVSPSEDTCNSICWNGGISASYVSNTESCTQDADVTLTLCADSC
ncbi:hypothetical protein N7532_007678 [Penicillium argentinense]|uniref:BYS1 domain protein n=1 Tax=Penicillium argentinense TaxID=1131581 RepID=A0A9W9K0V7_9EURO|nr:uncharacterized protein N7532_007678 [Penicillium argentinense]KAJ5088994.1 hypothetical protein N7532_007678 [Penicillium argentinense]